MLHRLPYYEQSAWADRLSSVKAGGLSAAQQPALQLSPNDLIRLLLVNFQEGHVPRDKFKFMDGTCVASWVRHLSRASAMTFLTRVEAGKGEPEMGCGIASWTVEGLLACLHALLVEPSGLTCSCSAAGAGAGAGAGAAGGSEPGDGALPPPDAPARGCLAACGDLPGGAGALAEAPMATRLDFAALAHILYAPHSEPLAGTVPGEPQGAVRSLQCPPT